MPKKTVKTPQKKAAEHRNLVQSRPAETGTGVFGAIALLLCLALQIDDPAVLTAITIVLSALPAAITYIVNLKRGS